MLLFAFNAEEFFGCKDFNKLDILRNNAHLRIVDDNDLLNAFVAREKELGQVPLWTELDATMRYKIKLIGGYKAFLKTFNKRPKNSQPSVEQIKEEYIRIRDLLEEKGERITLEKCGSHSDFSRNCFQTYPFSQLQKDCGDKPNIDRNFTKESLLSDYRSLEEELGRPPTKEDLEKKGFIIDRYTNKWGSLNNFLKEIGVTRSAFGLPREYSKSDLLCLYILLESAFKIKLEKPDLDLNQTILDSLFYGKGALLSSGTISKRFGGWKNFKKIIKENASIVKAISAIDTTLKNLCSQDDDEDKT